jgi:hypothetical protein
LGEAVTRFSESVVEDAARDWLQGLGWRVGHGPDIAPETPAPTVSRRGSARSRRVGKWFKPWRTSAGERLADPHLPELEVMIAGIFDKQHLLDNGRPLPRLRGRRWVRPGDRFGCRRAVGRKA